MDRFHPQKASILTKALHLPFKYNGVQAAFIPHKEKGELFRIAHRHPDGDIDISVSAFPVERFTFTLRKGVLSDCHYTDDKNNKTPVSPEECLQAISDCEVASREVGLFLPQVYSVSRDGSKSVIIGAVPPVEIAVLSIHDGVASSYEIDEEGEEIKMNPGVFLWHYRCPDNLRPEIDAAVRNKKSPAPEAGIF